MALVNQIKNRESQRRTIAVAAGLHDVDGELLWTKTIGTSPFHIVTRQVLGKGEWDGVVSVWYKGLNIPSTDYRFQDGSQTTPDTTFFPTDTNPHTGSVLLDVKAPENVGEADTKATTPALARGIFRTEKFPDFDSSGNQINPADSSVVVTYADLVAGTPLDKDYFTYTASPARVCVGWMFKYGKIKHWRINWQKWVDWRDYCAGLELVDYTTEPEGIGLTASFYSGTAFETFVLKRIDPVVQFDLSNGGPAIGVPTDNFSARWEGKIKPEYSETYTFKIVHDNGARLRVNGVQLINNWTDDGLTPVGGGVTSGTIALTADTLYDIKAEWNEGGGPGEFRLFWSSASRAEEIVPQDRLYPKAENRPRYEAHVAFPAPTTCDAMISAVLMVSNSIKQDVDGKIEFYCVEQLTPTFHFAHDNGTILQGTFKFYRSDRRDSEPQNVFEATFRDLDSQYVEEPLIPIEEKVQELIDLEGREIYGEVKNLFNMPRYQARKVLKHIVDRAARKDLFLEFGGTARSFKVVAGDLVTVTHELGGAFIVDKQFLVLDASDASPEETADTRQFRLQEF